MKRAWAAWVALMDRREPATALALVRIFAACALLGDLIEMRIVGAVHPLFAVLPDGFARPDTLWGSLFGGGPFGADLLWWAVVIALSLVIAGIATRAAMILYICLSLAQAALAPMSDRGVQELMRIVFVILVLSPSHTRCSVTAWWRARRGRPYAAEQPAWPRYLLMIQIAWMYGSAGQSKLGTEWGPGEFSALANVLCDPHIARFPSGWVAHALPLLALATLVTITFELTGPFYLLWYYFSVTRERPGRVRRLANKLRIRWLWLGLGVTMHVGIAVTLRLAAFPWGVLALYPVLLTPGELAAVLAYLRKTVAPAKRASSPS
ncbi:MAG TPA: HTTM domain-containing protein [Kofleriaceae bacterium]|jgi:hypothetical protein